MIEFIQNFDLAQWITAIGYIGLLTIIVLEMGVFFGFFLPGDSLVFTAGILAAQNVFNIWILVSTFAIAAILGYIIGYWFGKKLGKWLMQREDGIWFKKRYLEQADEFYQKHGGKALILGRLVPIVRTFIPIVAGMAKMPYHRYFIFNVIGALIWGSGITFIGYYVGTKIPEVGNYILPIVMLIVLLSIIPGLIKLLRRKKRRHPLA